MAEMDIVPYIGTRTPADFDTLFDELEAARGSSASLSDAIAEKADNATTLSGYGITDAYTKTETDTALSGKQGTLSQAQLAAVNSGITAEKLTADEAALAEVVDGGAKNIQPVELEIIKQSTTAGSWNGNVYTESGSTYTINDDGTITVDTTGLTNQSNLFLSPYLDISNGEWVVSGCPQGGTSETYYIATNSTSWGNPKEYGNGVELNIGNNKIRLAISVKVRSGILVFRPMICTKAAWDVSHAYEPYALPNSTLTPAAIKAVDEGAKNLFDYDVLGPNSSNIGTSVVVSGVRFTMNSDKSVTVNRETTSSQSAYVWFRKSDGSAIIVTDLCDDDHVFSGAAGGSESTYILYINNVNGSNAYKYFGDGGIIGTPKVTPNAAGISIAAGYSPSNLVIKPMICTAQDWAVSQKFVPYCPTIYELYQMILALQNGTRSAPALAKSADPEEIKEPETGEEGEQR